MLKINTTQKAEKQKQFISGNGKYLEKKQLKKGGKNGGISPFGGKRSIIFLRF